MIHIFNVLPQKKEPIVTPKHDICRKLPGCDSEFARKDFHWDKHTLQVTWSIVSNKTDGYNELNIQLWDRIFRGIDRRVNEDVDDEENIVVRVVGLGGDASLLACLLESRNMYLSRLDDLGYSSESKELAVQWTKIYVPLFVQKPNLNRRPDDTREFKRSFVRWACL